jgi:hypothetical protein
VKEKEAAITKKREDELTNEHLMVMQCAEEVPR